MYILLMYDISLLLLLPDGFVLCYIGLLVLTLWHFDDDVISPSSGKGCYRDFLIDIVDTREDLHMQRVSPVEEVEKIPLEGSSEKYLQVGSCLQESLKTKLVDFL